MICKFVLNIILILLYGICLLGYVNNTVAQSDSFSVVFEPISIDSSKSALPFFIDNYRSYRYPDVNHASKNKRFTTYGQSIFFELLSDSNTLLEAYEGEFNIGYDIVSISTEDSFDQNFIERISRSTSDTLPSEIVVSVPIFIKSGKFCQYRSDGHISTVGQYDNNQKVGKWYIFSEKGSLTRIEQYDNDTITSQKTNRAKSKKNRIKKRCNSERIEISSISQLPPLIH